jgi:hypothetical protein
MTSAALALDAVLVTVILAGAFARRRAPLAAVLLCTLVADAGVGVLAQPGPLDVMVIKLAKRGLLMLAVTEIAARIFHRGLPGGRQAVLRMLTGLLLLAATGAWLELAPAAGATDREWFFALVEAERRLSVAVALSATVVLSYCANRWPLDGWHRDLLAGLLVYHAAVMLLSPRPATAGWSSWPPYLEVAILCWWARAAWRGQDDPGWSSDVRLLVWPWLPRSAR